MSGMLPPVPTPMRRRVSGRRIRTSATSTAGEMIGQLAVGDELAGVTNGQYSLIDIIAHVLGQTGPADVTVATWTMGIYDQEEASRFCRDGRIRRIRWIVDPSFFSRRPELSGQLVEAFGVDSFRPVNSHAKWATIRGERLAVAIRSSMNLNPNRRIETFDISCDDALCAYFEGIVDSIFDARPEYDGGKPKQSQAIFTQILAKYEDAKKERPAMRKSKGWGRGWRAG